MAQSLWKALFIIYNICVCVCGVACLCVGLWMVSDPYVRSYFTILRRSLTDDALKASSGIVLAAGFFLIGMGVLGFFAVRRQSKSMLTFYLILMFIIMILQLVAGFLVVVFKDDIHMYVKKGMKNQIKSEYEFANSVGKAWNWVQVREKCCGADGTWDYEESNWWYGENPGVENPDDATVWVPKTCCRLHPEQDRDVRRVNPQDPKPRDEKRCQEDAAGKKDNSEYLNGKGCFAKLMGFIYRHMDTIIGLGLAIGFVQLFGFVSTLCFMCGIKDVPSYPEPH